MMFFLSCFFTSFLGGAAAKVVFFGLWLVVGGWLVLLNFRG